jgi:Ca2+-binding RTX toxin-like protein
MFGEAGNDIIFGGRGNDFLDGGAGSDTLRGDSGSDAVLGGTGNDFLFGDAGIDLLDGGAGIDVMRGGADSDIFRFRSDAGLVNAIADWDIFSSFGGEEDAILLQGIAGVTSLDNIFATETADGLQLHWGATAQSRVGGVLLVGKTLADVDLVDFVFA